MTAPERSDKDEQVKPRLTDDVRTKLRNLYGGINDSLYSLLDRIDAFATTAPECGSSPTINAGNNSVAGLAESQAPAPSEPGDRGVAPTASAPSPAPMPK